MTGETTACTHDDADKAPCPLCERDAEIARLRSGEPTEYALHHENVELRAENERLRAGIEKEALSCDEWAQHHERGNDSVSGATRAFRHRERAARLRALLQ